MLAEKLKDYNIILGSKSSRRKQFLKDLGIAFTSVTIETDEEDYPRYLHGNEITDYLVELKADSYDKPLAKNDILITADTIVRVSGRVLGKPKDAAEAKKMLRLLSDFTHEVITSVCIRTTESSKIIHDTTEVYFKKLAQAEIDFYIENYQPFDKAGAYGIQEWLGQIGVKKIKGSFYTVMGFPVHKFYKEMMKM